MGGSSQYSPQQDQNSSQNQSGSYSPPPLYGNTQSETSLDPGNLPVEVKPNPERQYITEKIAEIEKGLDSLFIKFYQIWLSLLSLSSFGGFAYIIYVLVTAKYTTNNLDMIIILLVLVMWIGIQSVYGLLSINQKDVSKANLACWMVVFGVIPGVLMVIKLIAGVVKYPDSVEDWASVVKVLMGAVSAEVLAHIVMGMVGAVKVRKILLEREVLTEKLNRIDYSFKA